MQKTKYLFDLTIDLSQAHGCSINIVDHQIDTIAQSSNVRPNCHLCSNARVCQANRQPCHRSYCSLPISDQKQ